MSAFDDLIAAKDEAPDATGLPDHVPLPTTFEQTFATFLTKPAPVLKGDVPTFVEVFKNGSHHGGGNPNHDGKTGEFTSGSEGASDEEPPTKDRPVVRQVLTVKEAIPLILAGHVVELKHAGKVNTLLTKLAAMNKDALEKGEKAPNYDACKITVKGVSFFCGQHLGMPRIVMPQLGGVPLPGTPAAKLPRDEKGRVDAGPEFLESLERTGVKTTSEEVTAASLIASQKELVGPVIAKRVAKKNYKPSSPIFISRDGYIIDGHHRWASVVGVDAEDKHLGDKTIRVVRVDMPITEVLQRAKRFSKRFGLPGASATMTKKSDFWSILTAPFT